MTQQNLLGLAKKGDPTAIAVLLNRILQPKGIVAKTELKNCCLHVMLEAAQAPDQELLSAFVQLGILKLEPESIETLVIYGYQQGASSLAWKQTVRITRPRNLPAVGQPPESVKALPPVASEQTQAGTQQSIVTTLPEPVRPSASTPSSPNLTVNVAAVSFDPSLCQPQAVEKPKPPQASQITKEIYRRRLIRQISTGLVATVVGFLLTASIISLLDTFEKDTVLDHKESSKGEKKGLLNW